MRLVFAIAALTLSASSAAESLVSGGYQETVFSVSDTEEWVESFTEVAGWEVLHRGAASPSMLEAWSLPDSASAMEVVVGNPGTNRGYVRLVQFSDVDQQQIRSNAQSWDTGGWFDVNSRIVSMDDKFAQLQARDWQAASDPVSIR